MTFMEANIKKSMGIWNECAETDFISELKRGILPPDKFRNYMIQDSIYLKHYARVFGKAIYHSTNLRDIQLYYAMLSFVTDKESAVRINYLNFFGITDDDIEFMQPLKENRNYIDFLLEIARKGNICEILMAVLPCMMSYSYIFRKIVKEPDTRRSRYSDFIQEYADNRYYEDCIAWGRFAERKCEPLADGEKEKLFGIFEKAGLLDDPVMYAKNGCPLMRPESVDTLIKIVIPFADVLTPNIPEAERIADMQIKSYDDMEKAAKKIYSMGCRSVIIKGGHAAFDATDILYDGNKLYYYKASRIDTKNTHGTGCTFSSAIAAWLGKGLGVEEAVRKSKEYITTAIRHSLSIGKGYGPTNHFYELYKNREYDYL